MRMTGEKRHSYSSRSRRNAPLARAVWAAAWELLLIVLLRSTRPLPAPSRSPSESSASAPLRSANISNVSRCTRGPSIPSPFTAWLVSGCPLQLLGAASAPNERWRGRPAGCPTFSRPGANNCDVSTLLIPMTLKPRRDTDPPLPGSRLATPRGGAPQGDIRREGSAGKAPHGMEISADTLSARVLAFPVPALPRSPCQGGTPTGHIFGGRERK